MNAVDALIDIAFGVGMVLSSVVTGKLMAKPNGTFSPKSAFGRRYVRGARWCGYVLGAGFVIFGALALLV
jgi:hypothetical protein